jgi:hypothetical protein
MKLSPKLEEYRYQDGELGSPPGSEFGAFLVPGPCGEKLKIVASGDATGLRGVEPELWGWEHVSVSTRRRIPNWQEMCYVKDLFWAPEECVVQFHVPKSAWISNHPYCLHMWRWAKGEFPAPPSLLVGVKEAGELRGPAHAAQVKRQYGL